ncbi:MAG: hypothetical protein JXB47_06115 [Anaerolineae bacterium]|nr:hypothetical protein [Anaerolineae bacterium]
MKLLRLAFLALLFAGCDVAPPEPTKSPLEQTYIARTVVAVSVQQTIDAQGTRAALNPIPFSPPTLTPLPTMPRITLTYTPTATAPFAPAATPAMSPPDSTPEPGGAISLPLKPGLSLELEWAEALAQAGRYTPRQGYFLVLHGTLVNRAAQDQCVYSHEIRLGFEGERYPPYVEAMGTMRSTYNIDYPGPFNGQCALPNSRTPTYILFDVPARMTGFAFFYRDVRAGSLSLARRGDGNFDIVPGG